MELNIPLRNRFSLTIADRSGGDGGACSGGDGSAWSGGDDSAWSGVRDTHRASSDRRARPDRRGGYPTARLQKGLLLRRGAVDLAEEGVGFGVPVLKRGIATVFPGDVQLTGRCDGALWEITAAFEMNLVERLTGPDGESVKPAPLYAAKNALAALHRGFPPLRGPLTATSNALRRRFGWVTTFEDDGTSTTVRVDYVIDGAEGRVGVTVETTGLPQEGVTELVMMNEQGAQWFDRYLEAGGADLRAGQVGTWDPVAAEWAAFGSTSQGVAFSLDRVDGARLYRGTELIGSRVAWSGFGYSLPPTTGRFAYDLRIDSIP